MPLHEQPHHHHRRLGSGAGPEYALEGSVFMAGALMQWLRDDMGIIDDVAETSAIARSVNSTDGVYVVPAFTGLGAPYWDCDARGAIYGLTRGTGRAHIVRAALESLAYQVHDLAVAMEADAGVRLSVLNVDSGASANDFLMQFQSDILRTPLRRPQNARDDRARRRVPRRARHRVLEGRGSPVRPTLFGRRVRAGHGGRAPREAAGRLGSRREAHDGRTPCHPERSAEGAKLRRKASPLGKDPVRRQPSRDEREEEGNLT